MALAGQHSYPWPDCFSVLFVKKNVDSGKIPDWFKAVWHYGGGVPIEKVDVEKAYGKPLVIELSLPDNEYEN